MRSTADIDPNGKAMYDATRQRRHRKRVKRNDEEEVSELNITPMLDMMTILLVFLLKSFGSSASNVNVENLVLPHSTTTLKVEEGLQLMVTKAGILVDQKPVLEFNSKQQIKTEDLPEGPDTYLIGPLYNALQDKADYFKKIEDFGGTQFNGRIAIIADKNVPYQMLFKILYSAGRAEFGSFKLFVQSTD